MSDEREAIIHDRIWQQGYAVGRAAARRASDAQVALLREALVTIRDADKATMPGRAAFIEKVLTAAPAPQPEGEHRG